MTDSNQAVASQTDEVANDGVLSLTQHLQQKCSHWGTYWRAADAHGVILTHAQAIELLQDALGVEVELTDPLQALADENARLGLDY